MIPSPPLGTDAAADRPTGLGAAAEAGPDRAGAARRFRFELAAHPASPAQARRLARARLTHWAVGEDTCDSAALVVSELVTNAIMHTASRRVVCELHEGDDLVRIAVRDEGCAPGEPHPSPQRPEEEHGRGLLLVDALCHSWGAHEHGPGLLVWAELPHKGDTPRDDSAVPRNDLGWGARPKPEPSGGSGEEDEPAAHHRAAHPASEDAARPTPEEAARPTSEEATPPASEETAHHRALPDTEARHHGTESPAFPPIEQSRDRGRM
ncbi:ATP-binding protein [Streptomyces plumbiresistens]|uniref:ATP-binding protein n=1 Tax=Streptomyces plumbiresistens TaxID=511811 RepID=A0ABP7SHU0_9ACTN